MEINISESFPLLYEQVFLFVPKVIAALTIFILGIYGANLLTRLIEVGLRRRKLPAEVIQFISTYGRLTLITLVVIIALQQVNFDLTAFIAGLGIFGFIAGFALQDITQNIVSGLILYFQQPFEINDLVEIDNFTGYVTSIDIRATNLRTIDDRDILIPNYSVITNPIMNYTRDPQIRLDLSVSISYDDNLEAVQQLTFDAVSALPFVLEDPEPEILYHTFGESAVELIAYYWVDILHITELKARDGVLRAIFNAYRRNNIVIPFPIAVELDRIPQKPGQ